MLLNSDLWLAAGCIIKIECGEKKLNYNEILFDSESQIEKKLFGAVLDTRC